MTPGRRRVPRRGGVAVWVLASLSVLIGVIAIGTDGGRMMDERHRVQAAADAAALAAAGGLYENYRLNQGTDPLGTAKAAALAVAAANGYANDGTNSVVEVNIPPQSGQYARQADYIEVVITSNLEAGFSRGLGRDRLPIRGRAVARGRPTKIGLIALQPTGTGLSVGGTGTFRVLNAPITVNSADAAAFTNSNNTVVAASSFEIAGGYSNSGTITGPVHTGVPPALDPLRTFPQPDPAAYPLRSDAPYTASGQPVTLQPGVYRGGISITGGAAVTLQPGIYILDGGGLSVGGQGRLTGTGVMIFNTGGANAGPISLIGHDGVTLTPPLDGTYAGISIFQDRALGTDLKLSGGGNLNISGTVYAPGAAAELNGSGTMNLPGFIVARLSVTGGAVMVVDASLNPTKSPDVRLVE